MKKFFFVLMLAILVIPTIYGMQSLQSNCTDIMKIIFEYATWIDITTLDAHQKPKVTSATITNDYSIVYMAWSVSPPKENKYTKNLDGLWHTIKRNHHLQYVSKDFKRLFWDCFSSHKRFTLQEKNEFIATLLRMWNQGNFHDTYFNLSPMPPIADIAVNIQAGLNLTLTGSIVTTRTCNPEFVRVILDTNNSNVINQSDDYGWTPLCKAILYDDNNSHLKIVQLLLTYPDIQVNPLPKQMCPLYWAVYHRKIDIVKWLLAHPDIQINALDNYSQGETALFAAIQSSCPDIKLFRSMIDLLITAGIDESITNKKGETALDIAYSYKNTARAEALEHALAMKNKTPTK